MICYFDSSALIKLLLQEPGRSEAMAVREEAASSVTVSLAYTECRAALARAAREGRITSPIHRFAKAGLRSLLSDTDSVDVDDALIQEAGDIAEIHALRGYDAVHLAAALKVEANVVATWDEDLARAAREAGMAVVGGR